MGKIPNKGLRTPIRLQSLGLVFVLTTSLARPLADTMGVELHEEDVRPAGIGVPIQGAFRGACHEGIAIHIHLRKVVSWALQCAADARGNSKKSKTPTG